MSEKPTAYPAGRLASSRVARGFIAGLFTAGASLACMSLFEMVSADMLPYLFGLILFFGFIGSQIQERMRRMTSPD